MQGLLFETTITDIYPAPFNTADCKTIGDGDDGQQYIIKQCSDNIHTPATEFLCCSIAELCKVGCLDFRPVTMPDKSIAFGSRFESGQIKQEGLAGVLTSKSKFFSQSRSSVYVLDLFLGNPDRHLNNFFFYTDASNEIRAKVFDFGRSLWGVDGIMPTSIAQPSDSNTRVTFEGTQLLYDSDVLKMYSVLDYLNNIDVVDIRNICSKMPKEWLHNNMQQTLEAWWLNDKPLRISQLKGGIQNGQLI